MSSLIQKVRDLSELVMFQHTIFSLPFIIIAMIVAANGWFGWTLLGWGILAATTARSFAMGFNRYADRDIDKDNPRTQSRPSVDGRLDEQSILMFTTLNAAGFIFSAYMINTTAFYLSFPVLLLLASYSLFKRFSWTAHLMLGVCLGFAPLAGTIAVSESTPLWSLYLSGGVLLWVAGFDLLYSLQDMAYDQQRGLHSIPSRFGITKTLMIARFFHLGTTLLWCGFVVTSGLGLGGWLAVILTAVMLGYEHHLVSRSLSNINKAFFTVNGYLGLAFLMLVVCDYIIF